MKKIISLFFVLNIISTSCDQKPDDIKFSEIKTACDYIDALYLVTNSLDELLNDKNSADEFTVNDLEKVNKMNQVIDELKYRFQSKFRSDEMKGCSNFEPLVKLHKKMETDLKKLK